MPSNFDRLSTIKHDHTHHQKQESTPQKAQTNTENASVPTQVPTDSNSIRRTYDPSRVPSGIRGFDQMIEGGFQENSINLLSGGSGTGKTVFAVEFLINGIYMFNEPGVYITFDEENKSIIKNMKTLGWDLEKLEKEKKLSIVEYSPEQMMKILNEGGGLLDNLMSTLNAKRLVVDSISTFLLMSGDEYGRREHLANLFKLLRKWDVTCLLTNQFTPLSGHEIKKESLSISFEVDSITQLYYLHDTVGTDRRRMIEVYKMRGTNHTSKAVPFVIDSKGIDITSS